MKTYETYWAQYRKAISPGLLKHDEYIIKPNVFISMKWQEDNNWNPWDRDANARLDELRTFDERLYTAVTDGIHIMEETLNDLHRTQH